MLEVEYKWKTILCYGYKQIGHGVEVCKKVDKMKEWSPKIVQQQQNVEVFSSHVMPEGGCSRKNSKW